MKTKKLKGISASTLKIIALITMFIDHVGAALLEEGLLPVLSSRILARKYSDYIPIDYELWNHIYIVLRLIGRISFPIYCFLLVEGFSHTKSVKKYAMRLGLFALISEIPFNLAFYGEVFHSGMNVFFTLLIGLCTIWSMKALETLPSWQSLQIPFRILIAFTGMIIARFLRTDYADFGVLLIVLLYLFRNNRKQQSIVGAISIICEFINTIWKYTAPLAFLCTYFYNGERGKQLPKAFFYSFYPIHLLLLFTIRILLF